MFSRLVMRAVMPRPGPHSQDAWVAPTPLVPQIFDHPSDLIAAIA